MKFLRGSNCYRNSQRFFRNQHCVIYHYMLSTLIFLKLFYPLFIAPLSWKLSSYISHLSWSNLPGKKSLSFLLSFPPFLLNRFSFILWSIKSYLIYIFIQIIETFLVFYLLININKFGFSRKIIPKERFSLGFFDEFIWFWKIMVKSSLFNFSPQ